MNTTLDTQIIPEGAELVTFLQAAHDIILTEDADRLAAIAAKQELAQQRTQIEAEYQRIDTGDFPVASESKDHLIELLTHQRADLAMNAAAMREQENRANAAELRIHTVSAQCAGLLKRSALRDTEAVVAVFRGWVEVNCGAEFLSGPGFQNRYADLATHTIAAKAAARRRDRALSIDRLIDRPVDVVAKNTLYVLVNELADLQSQTTA